MPDSRVEVVAYSLGMQPLVGNDHLASGLFAAVFGCWILFEMALTGRTGRRRGATRGDRGSNVLIFGSMFAAFFIMGVTASVSPARMAGDVWAIFAGGIVLACAGIGLRLWAIRVLGPWFRAVITTAPDQPVVDRGPYSLIRHPSYAGALVTVLGAALCFADWLSLLAVVPVFFAYVYRIRVEEAALEKQLGPAYTSYRERTKRLVPFVF